MNCLALICADMRTINNLAIGSWKIVESVHPLRSKPSSGRIHCCDKTLWLLWQARHSSGPPVLETDHHQSHLADAELVIFHGSEPW